jgi:hypothetical protein
MKTNFFYGRLKGEWYSLSVETFEEYLAPFLENTINDHN